MLETNGLLPYQTIVSPSGTVLQLCEDGVYELHEDQARRRLLDQHLMLPLWTARKDTRRARVVIENGHERYVYSNHALTRVPVGSSALSPAQHTGGGPQIRTRRYTFSCCNAPKKEETVVKVTSHHATASLLLHTKVAQIVPAGGDTFLLVGTSIAVVAVTLVDRAKHAQVPVSLRLLQLSAAPSLPLATEAWLTTNALRVRCPYVKGEIGARDSIVSIPIPKCVLQREKVNTD